MSNIIKFLDHGHEGSLAMCLSSSQMNQPYLICYKEFDEDFYRNYDPLTDSYSGDIWYLEHLNQLDKITSLNSHECKYSIYKITNNQACAAIWSMAGFDKGINSAIVSGLSNVSDLVDVIDENYYCADKFVTSQCSEWAYWLNYGGSSDEYYAMFESTNNKTFIEMKNLVLKMNLTITKTTL